MSYSLPTKKRLSVEKMFTNPNVKDLWEAVALIAQREARDVIKAQNPAAMTDSSTGVAGVALAAILLPGVFAGHVAATADLAPRAAFNTAIGKIDNALAVIGTYLNSSAFTPLAGTEVITLNATGVVAVAGTIPAQDKTLTGVTGEADKAAQTLTFTGQPANNETVTVGGKVYTFQTSLTNVDGNVFIGASTAASIVNLIAAINLGAGSGTGYAAAMTLNANVTASQGAGTTMIATAKVGGTAGNSIASTETVTNASWGAATLAGGAQDTALLCTEADAAIQRQLNNLATIVKAYNHLAVATGQVTIMDNTTGKPDLTGLGVAGLTLYDKVTAATSVTSGALAASAVVSKAAVDTALTTFANNIAFIAAQLATVIFASANLAKKNTVIIVP